MSSKKLEKAIIEFHEYEIKNIIELLESEVSQPNIFYMERDKKKGQLKYTIRKLKSALESIDEERKVNEFWEGKEGCRDCVLSKHYIQENHPEWHKEMMESKDETYKEYQQTEFCATYDSLTDKEKSDIAKGYSCEEYDDEDK